MAHSQTSSSSHHSIRPMIQNTGSVSNLATGAGPPDKVGTNGDPVLAKRRARNLLRDYYGLTNTEMKHDKSNSSHQLIDTNPNSLDSPYFDSRAYFEKLVKTSSFETLLSTTNRLMSEVRALDGERQSLVYNHHHELVEASATIGKMKTSAETLDGTLDELQNSFSKISELTTALSRSIVRDSSDVSLRSKNEDFDPSIHLPPLISLPTILRGLSNERSSADQLWGEWEPAVRSFEEAGVEGAKRIGNECREVLRQARNQHKET